jgi:hypothetical protein
MFLTESHKMKMHFVAGECPTTSLVRTKQVYRESLAQTSVARCAPQNVVLLQFSLSFSEIDNPNSG